MSSIEIISVTKGYICLFALLCESRRPSLYKQQVDSFIGQMITEIWAFQEIVFGLGDHLDLKPIPFSSIHSSLILPTLIFLFFPLPLQTLILLHSIPSTSHHHFPLFSHPYLFDHSLFNKHILRRYCMSHCHSPPLFPYLYSYTYSCPRCSYEDCTHLHIK